MLNFEDKLLHSNATSDSEGKNNAREESILALFLYHSSPNQDTEL